MACIKQVRAEKWALGREEFIIDEEVAQRRPEHSTSIQATAEHLGSRQQARSELAGILIDKIIIAVWLLALIFLVIE
ncbi:hypothetical protein [Halomonas sp. I5-271120]|uniref:hypothetical protein n=1 Tax=Halomonas sp. I5-271120 TaxID=3061632 RepID=UPI0027155502|nr:hypothetical protein [Halomonas sp. I5-271120]